MITCLSQFSNIPDNLSCRFVPRGAVNWSFQRDINTAKMHAEQTAENNPPEAEEMRLTPSKIDFTSYRTQIAAGSITAILVLLALNYVLLDNPLNNVDQSFVAAVRSAIGGGLGHFYDRLPELEPALSWDGVLSSVAAAKLAWIGFDSPLSQHILNLGLMAATVFFVSQITSEICGRFGNRLRAIPAAWAGLLYAVSPIQAEWLIDVSLRAELLCTFFYLGAVFSYLRFRITNSKPILRIALLATLMALLCRPEAMTLPAVITVLELLLPAAEPSGAVNVRRPQRLVSILLFWLVLFFASTVSAVAPNLVHFPPISNLVAAYRDNLGLGMAALSVSLPLLLLPIMIPLSARTTKGATIIGSLILALITGVLFVSSLQRSQSLELQSSIQPNARFVWPAPAAMPSPPQLAPVYSTRINEHTLKDIQFEPANYVRGKDEPFGPDKASLTPLPDAVRVMPGTKQALTVWLPGTNIDPRKASVAAVKLLYTSKTGCHTCQEDNLKVVWQRSDSPAIDTATISNISFGQYLVWLGRYGSWYSAPSIKRIGFQLAPGDYFVDLSEMDLIPYARTSPLFAIQTGTLSYDCRAIPNAAGIKIFIGVDEPALPPSIEAALYKFDVPSDPDRPAMELELLTPTGSVQLPQQLLRRRGTYQVRVMALDAAREQIGLPSVPLILEVQ